MAAETPVLLSADLPAPPASLSSQPSSPSSSPCSTPTHRLALLTPHSFPVDWLCSTCGATHSVLEILSSSSSGAVHCDCENPTLQAVYDQFGRIFLYWRNDPAIVDLRSPDAVREAAWRVAEASGGRAEWLAQVLGKEGKPRLATKGSQSSLSSSEDAEDMDISE